MTVENMNLNNEIALLLHKKSSLEIVFHNAKSAYKTKIIIHQRSNGKNVILVNSCTHNLQPDLVILLYYNVLINSLVTRRI